jgi:carbohydrate-selective porin OprB
VRTLLTLFLSRFRASLGLTLVLVLAGITAAGAETARRPAEPRVFGDMEWRNWLFEKDVDLQLVHVSTTLQNQRITQVAMLQNALGLGPVPVKDSEYVFELDYTFVPVPGFQIRPNLQYIYSPGESSLTRTSGYWD